MGGKLDEKWFGPYIICGVTEYGNYKLQCHKTKTTLKQQVPASQLKSYNQRMSEMVSSKFILYTQTHICIYVDESVTTCQKLETAGQAFSFSER